MKKLSAIESFTGGLFASKIVSYPNASRYFKGSLVAYSNKIKQKLGLKIENGVMNKETVLAMTRLGNKFFKSDICVAFVGNAGPTSLENLKVGNVFIAINENVYELHLNGSRNEIRKKAVKFAFQKLKLKEWNNEKW